MNLDLNGRVAIITGGGKGVGAGISRQLAAEGVKVVVAYHSNADMAIAHAKKICELGGIAEAYKVDVEDRKQVDAMMSYTANLFGGIDIIVNNAAWQPNYDIDEYTEKDYDSIMNINFGGYFRCMQAAIPYLKKSTAGRVIMISSVHGKRPGDFDVCYSMSKGAIKMMTREAAIELGDYGITVNAILPGAVQIEFKSGRTMPFKRVRVMRDRRYKWASIGRMCVPDDVGNLVVFLASKAAEYITGTSTRIDGGSMLL